MSSHISPGSTPGHSSQKTLHANLLIIDSLGILITGEPDIGKSELTLALLDRGHQLVCDDVVDIKQENNKLIGTCPSIASGYILISGIGIIDIPKLFGVDTVVNQHKIDLLISLVKPENKLPTEDPLNPVYQNEKILGITLPKIVFPVHVGRSLPLLIETLVRNHRLKLEGYDPSINFDKRFQKAREFHDPQKNKNHQ